MKKIKKIIAGALAAALTLSLGASLVACGGGGTEYTFEAEDAVLADPAGAQNPLVVQSGNEWAGFDEDGNVIEGETEVTHLGYFGAAADQKITWTIKSDKACSATLTLRAASCAQEQEGSPQDWMNMKVKIVAMNCEDAATLTVNDAKVELNGELPGIDGEFAGMNMGQAYGSGMKNFGTVTAKINLKAGDNTIIISSVGGVSMNIDKITIKAPATLTFEKTDNSDRVSAQ